MFLLLQISPDSTFWGPKCMSWCCAFKLQVQLSYPRRSSWLPVSAAPWWRRMERGVVGGDVSHWIVALSSCPDWTARQQHNMQQGHIIS